jgi:hypothetical protein
MAWELAGNGGTNPAANFLGTTDGKPLAIQPGNGNVGIGTSTPSSKLEIAAQDGLQIRGFQPFLTLKDSNSNDARARIQNADGDINFFTEASFGSGIPPMKIVNSSSTVQIASQDALQIVGFQPFLTLADSNSGFARARIQNANGDINFFTEASFGSGIPPMKIVNSSGNVEVTGDIELTNADCAEDFNIGGTEITVDAGSVMVLGEGGALFPSQHVYDKRVAGVISGAGDYKPGIVLDKQNSEGNRQSIALLGKVYCKVDAEYGAIEVGDLLTTSATPGHAMKADDPAKAFGAVLGKALRSLGNGQELIPILVTLQ